MRSCRRIFSQAIQYRTNHLRRELISLTANTIFVDLSVKIYSIFDDQPTSSFKQGVILNLIIEAMHTLVWRDFRIQSIEPDVDSDYPQKRFFIVCPNQSGAKFPVQIDGPQALVDPVVAEARAFLKRGVFEPCSTAQLKAR
jgi:hypothetical protein